MGKREVFSIHYWRLSGIITILEKRTSYATVWSEAVAQGRALFLYKGVCMWRSIPHDVFREGNNSPRHDRNACNPIPLGTMGMPVIPALSTSRPAWDIMKRFQKKVGG